MELMQIGAEKTKTVLILMSDTGGGHRASAEAIKAAFKMEFGDEYKKLISWPSCNTKCLDWETRNCLCAFQKGIVNNTWLRFRVYIYYYKICVHVTDLWKEHTPWPFNQIPKSYNFLVRHETLWKLTFYGTVPRCIHCPQFVALSAFIAREVEKGLRKYQPDIIISVHPAMQHIPLHVIKSRGLPRKILFTTVITDLNTCHPTWFHKRVARCYCPTEEVARRALDEGLDPNQIRTYGLPVRPSFSKSLCSKGELRKRMSMDETLRTVLLMGGGEGMGPVEETAQAIDEKLFDKISCKPVGQLVVVCGRNIELRNKLESIRWKIPVQVRGFESNMEEWMGASDCIITKAGPGTIAEALIQGLPIILNNYIAGQEAGNIPYVVENGAGVFCQCPKEIASTISIWFGPGESELKFMSQNALRLARPDSVFKIVRDIDDLLRQRDLMPKYINELEI